MAAKLPDVLRVGPYTYTVSTVEGLGDLGQTDADDGVIRLDPDRPLDKLRSTLLHEVLHACHHAAGLREADEQTTNEDFVRRVEPWLLGVLLRGASLAPHVAARPPPLPPPAQPGPAPRRPPALRAPALLAVLRRHPRELRRPPWPSASTSCPPTAGASPPSRRTARTPSPTPPADSVPAPRVCSTPGCPTLVPRAGRCRPCSSEHERQRGTAAQRGYGREHQDARAAALRTYSPDDPCVRCGEPLGDDPSRLHLDHTDDRRGYRGLAHDTCNLRAAGLAAHGLREGGDPSPAVAT